MWWKHRMILFPQKFAKNWKELNHIMNKKQSAEMISFITHTQTRARARAVTVRYIFAMLLTTVNEERGIYFVWNDTSLTWARARTLARTQLIQLTNFCDSLQEKATTATNAKKKKKKKQKWKLCEKKEENEEKKNEYTESALNELHELTCLMMGNNQMREASKKSSSIAKNDRKRESKRMSWLVNE